MLRISSALGLCLLTACGPSVAPTDAGMEFEDAGVVDAGQKYDHCASTFGTQFTASFGRVDGTVVAVIPPTWLQCALPNNDHVVIQVQLDGGVHRLVVNVLSTSVDPNIRILERHGPLPAPAFETGWHPGLTLDYANTLGIHSTDTAWQSVDMAHASALVSDAISIGAPISVYASSSGGTNASSVHLIHRHARNDDGAIVIDPTSADPKWLLFRFAEQSF